MLKQISNFPSPVRILVLILENPGQNILKLYVFVQVQLATSKLNLDILYNKLSIQVASRVATQLKS